MFAFSHDGEPLTADHGGPLRLIVPHLYLWKSVKWVRGLSLMAEEQPGFWEQNGYHIYGDPWKGRGLIRPVGQASACLGFILIRRKSKPDRLKPVLLSILVRRRFADKLQVFGLLQRHAEFFLEVLLGNPVKMLLVITKGLV